MSRTTKNKTIRSIKIAIKGSEWTFNLLSYITYTKKHGDDSCGITSRLTKTVDFLDKHWLIATLHHEIFHVMLAETATDSANLSTDQLEEVAAEIYAKHVYDMLTIADKIAYEFMRESNDN